MRISETTLSPLADIARLFLLLLMVCGFFQSRLCYGNDSTLGEVVDAFRMCGLDGVVYVPEKRIGEAKARGVATHKYLLKLGKLDERDGIVRFAVKDTYHGLQVLYLDVPQYASRDDNQLWRIYFDSSYKSVRSTLSRALAIRLPSKPTTTQDYDKGQRPAILIDLNSGKPFLTCNKTEMGD